MTTWGSGYEDIPDSQLNILERLCKEGKHDLTYDTWGSECKRKGCKYAHDID